MELNTSQPHHSEIMTKPSRNPILFIVVGIVIIVIAALALLLWQKNQEIGQALNQLSDTEKRLTDSLSTNKDKSSGPALEDVDMSSLSENDQKNAAALVASEYACSVTSFTCNKAQTTVTTFQKVTDKTAGFAKVSTASGDGAKVTTWLKYRAGGSQWVVIYEGEAMPSAAVIKQFDIPTDFLAVN